MLFPTQFDILLKYLKDTFVKKEIERFYLDRLKDHFSGFPEGEIIPREPPDFLVKNGFKTVGVEVTEFHLDSSINALSPERVSLREKVREHAENICNAKNLSSVWVTIHFAQDFSCRVSEIKRIASQLADLVEPLQIDVSNQIAFELNEVEISNVISITARKVMLSKSLWTAPSARFLPELDFSYIQKILDKKSSLCEVYRKHCDEIWLMIVMDRFDPSSFATIAENVQTDSLTHAFDFAFLFVHCYTQNSPLMLSLGQIKPKYLVDGMHKLASRT